MHRCCAFVRVRSLRGSHVCNIRIYYSCSCRIRIFWNGSVRCLVGAQDTRFDSWVREGERMGGGLAHCRRMNVAEFCSYEMSMRGASHSVVLLSSTVLWVVRSECRSVIQALRSPCVPGAISSCWHASTRCADIRLVSFCARLPKEQYGRYIYLAQSAEQRRE